MYKQKGLDEVKKKELWRKRWMPVSQLWPKIKYIHHLYLALCPYSIEGPNLSTFLTVRYSSLHSLHIARGSSNTSRVVYLDSTIGKYSNICEINLHITKMTNIDIDIQVWNYQFPWFNRFISTFFLVEIVSCMWIW